MRAVALVAVCSLLAPGCRRGGPRPQTQGTRDAGSVPHRFVPSPPEIRGVALGLYSEDPGWSYEPLLREIRTVGANTVSLVAAYYLADIHATSIQDHPRYTAPDRTLVRTIRQAHGLGLRVLLFPILRVSYKPTPDHWRGNLRPRDRTELARSYARLLVRLGRIAEREGVEMFSVGSELSSLDTDPRWFAPAVARLRQVYHGRLVYSANWDHFEQVRIWPLVDELGVCAYFPLLDRGQPVTGRALLAAWRRLRRRLEAWARGYGKPLVLTEVGYMSQQGAAAEPWNEGAHRPVDLQVQRLAYEAFVHAWNGSKSLHGVFFWNWYGWGGPMDGSYVPRGKPAAAVLARWYGGRVPEWWDPRRDFTSGR